ncbi:hypothetical protein V8F20_010369 [Naviculisporaceae sp. PSN 640]
MEPLAAVATIGSLCGLAVKLISTVSEFIDQVQQAPKEVQALNTELASLYAGLGHIKMAEVEVIVKKAKKTETTGSARQMLKTVRFVFKASQVQFLRRRIVSQNGILEILLAVLIETRGSHIEQRLEDIHTKVDELLSSRHNIKEVLVVLEREDDNQQADYVLSDRTSRTVPQSVEKTAQPPTTLSSPVPEWMSAAMSWMDSPTGRMPAMEPGLRAFKGSDSR